MKPLRPALPAGALDDRATRVLLAVVRLRGTVGWVYIDDLTAATGLRRSVVHRRLRALLAAGLVTREVGLAGTRYRPLVTPLPPSPNPS